MITSRSAEQDGFAFQAKICHAEGKKTEQLRALMRHEQIQQWFGLPAGSWPPDHFALLGLKAGEDDLNLIEQAVHDRMEIARRYQLPQPELATEAMNRLAQAMICLIDPEARAAYLVSLRGQDVVAAEPVTPASLPESAPPMAGPLADVSPPQINREVDFLHQSQSSVDQPTAVEAKPYVQGLPMRQEEQAPFSRQGILSRRGMYQRVIVTRRLIDAWDAIGAFVGQPARVIQKPREATTLINQMKLVLELSSAMPPLLGEAGQSGYHVLMLARQSMIVPTLQTLLPSQRLTLSRDWQAGKEQLECYRDFLRLELAALQRKTRWAKMIRLLYTESMEAQLAVLVVLALVTLNILYDWLSATLPAQAAVFVGYLFFRFLFWWRAVDSRRVAESKPRKPTPAARRSRAKAAQAAGLSQIAANKTGGEVA